LHGFSSEFIRHNVVPVFEQFWMSEVVKVVKLFSFCYYILCQWKLQFTHFFRPLFYSASHVQMKQTKLFKPFSLKKIAVLCMFYFPFFSDIITHNCYAGSTLSAIITCERWNISHNYQFPAIFYQLCIAKVFRILLPDVLSVDKKLLIFYIYIFLPFQ
jgi:hypothetical protein